MIKMIRHKQLAACAIATVSFSLVQLGNKEPSFKNSFVVNSVMAESRLRSEEEAMKDQASKDGKVAVKALIEYYRNGTMAARSEANKLLRKYTMEGSKYTEEFYGKPSDFGSYEQQKNAGTLLEIREGAIAKAARDGGRQSNSLDLISYADDVVNARPILGAKASKTKISDVFVSAFERADIVQLLSTLQILKAGDQDKAEFIEKILGKKDSDKTDNSPDAKVNTLAESLESEIKKNGKTNNFNS